MPSTSVDHAATRDDESVPHARSTQHGDSGRRPAGRVPPTAAEVARRATLLLAAALVTVDVLLLAANLAHLRLNEPDEASHPIFSATSWDGDLDGSSIELWGQVQLVAAVVVLGWLAVRRRAAVFAAWVLVLTAVTADDLLMLHETFAWWFIGRFDVPAVAGLRPLDLGELTAWAIAAAVLGPLLLLTHLRARGRDRRTSRAIVAVMAVLVAFAVVVDMLHIVLEPHVPLVVGTAMTLTETTGELGVMTALLVVAYGAAVRTDLD